MATATIPTKPSAAPKEDIQAVVQREIREKANAAKDAIRILKAPAPRRFFSFRVR